MASHRRTRKIKYLSISGGLLSDGGGGGVEQWSAIDAGPRQVWPELFTGDAATCCALNPYAQINRWVATLPPRSQLPQVYRRYAQVVDKLELVNLVIDVLGESHDGNFSAAIKLESSIMGNSRD